MCETWGELGKLHVRPLGPNLDARLPAFGTVSDIHSGVHVFLNGGFSHGMFFLHIISSYADTLHI
jgi:hypothetical protein